MTTPSIETGMGIRAESISAKPPTPQTPSGFITAKSIPENLCSSAIGPSFTKIHSTGRMRLIAAATGQSRLVSMLGVAGQQVEGVRQEALDGAQTALGARRAAGEVDDESSPCDATHAPAKGCKRCFLRPAESDLLGDTGNEPVTYCKSRLWGHVTLRNAGAACR